MQSGILSSFKLTWMQRYLLTTPNTSITVPLGQPCAPYLEAPQNGTIECSSDYQVTDENCSFTCDHGFEFHGSPLRLCHFNNEWTGVQPYCAIKSCATLQRPLNGYIATKPCQREYASACEVQCVEGYHHNESSPYYQTCEVDTSTNSVYWSPPPVCERK